MKSYEVLTDNWPRRQPLGKGTIVQSNEAAMRYAVIDGDVKLGTDEKPASKKPSLQKAAK